MSRITPYGAFLTLEGGKVGLVHISEIDRNYVKDVHEHLRENDVVQAKVIAIKEDGKIDLSIKALQDPAPPVSAGARTPDFESMLKKFMRSSEERQVDYKRVDRAQAQVAPRVGELRGSDLHRRRHAVGPRARRPVHRRRPVRGRASARHPERAVRRRTAGRSPRCSG